MDLETKLAKLKADQAKLDRRKAELSQAARKAETRGLILLGATLLNMVQAKDDRALALLMMAIGHAADRDRSAIRAAIVKRHIHIKDQPDKMPPADQVQRPAPDALQSP
jgi:hypothetical protein